MKKLAVIGWPIKHTLSPAMHGAALAKANLSDQFSYEKVAVEPGGVPEFLDRIRSGEYFGTNVTIPHKVSVFENVDSHDATARMIGACNTVVRQPDGTLKGYNTDAYGALEAISDETGLSVTGKNVLILGAGGAAMACAVGAAIYKASSITILNRTLEKAEQIIGNLKAQDFSKVDSIEYRAINKPDSSLKNAEIILQMTSLGMKDSDPLPVDINYLSEEATLLEAVYVPLWTPLRQKCHDKGLQTVDGLKMLVGQGAVSFKLWTEVEPDRQVMLNAISS